MSLFDIVIPAFGRSALLAEAIDSVRLQTVNDWRLWVIDDGSPEALVLPVRPADERIHMLRLPQNCGPAYARNYGVAQGNAPLVAFLDSDDLWHYDKLRHALQAFQHDSGLQWWHSNEVWLRNGQTVRQRALHRKQGGQFLERALQRCLISPSAVVLRRNFFVAHKGFAPAFRLCEDYELWLRLLLHCPVGYSEEALTIKRAGEWPQLSSAREIDRYRVLAMHRVWRRQRGSMNRSAQKALLDECVRKSTLLLAGAEKHGNRPGQRRYQAWLTLFSTLRTRPMR